VPSSNQRTDKLRVSIRGGISKHDLNSIFEDKIDGIETLCIEDRFDEGYSETTLPT